MKKLKKKIFIFSHLFFLPTVFDFSIESLSKSTSNERIKKKFSATFFREKMDWVSIHEESTLDVKCSLFNAQLTAKNTSIKWFFNFHLWTIGVPQRRCVYVSDLTHIFFRSARLFSYLYSFFPSDERCWLPTQKENKAGMDVVVCWRLIFCAKFFLWF